MDTVASSEIEVPTWISSWFRGASIYGAFVLLGSLANLSPDVAVRSTQLAFVGVAGAFQWIFWIIGSDPRRYRRLIPVAIMEKVAFAVPALILADSMQDASVVRALAFIDLFLAVGFVKGLLCVSQR